MKTLITTAFLSLCALASNAQSKFSILGNVPGLTDSAEVRLISAEGYEPKKLAECKVKDGRFTLTGEYSKPLLCKMSFYVPGKKGKMKACDIRMMLDPKPVTFTADTTAILHSRYSIFAEAKVRFEGSDIQKQYMELLNATRAKERTADSASYAQAEAWFNSHGDEDVLKDYKQREAEAKAEYTACLDEFLVQHPDYYPTAALLSQRLYKDFTYTAEQYDAWLAMLQNNPDTAHVNFIRRNLDKAKQYALGAKYKDFQGKRPDNSMASLSSLMQEGKYTLIDFWASWCGPCRAAIPKVKAMTEEFKNLQVVSVSVDEKEEAWRKAEKAENMPWHQLLLQGDNYKNATLAYMVNSIPRLVLIAPDGAILIATHDPSLIKEKLLKNQDKK